MNQGFSITLSDKLLLLIFVNIAPSDGIKLTCLPVDLGSLSSVNLVIELGLIIMALHVPISYYVVVSLNRDFIAFSASAFLLSRLRTFAWRLIVMVFLIIVADNVVIDECILARAEVPLLLLRVIRSVF